MAKPLAMQKSAHKIIIGLLKKGYSYRELALFYEESPSLLHRIGNNPNYDEHVSLRNLLNSKTPDFEPKRNPKYKAEKK